MGAWLEKSLEKKMETYLNNMKFSKVLILKLEEVLIGVLVDLLLVG